MSTPSQTIAVVARELYALVLDKLRSGQGVHAETAIMSAARVAGAFALCSCELPLDELKPGSAVFSEAVDREGERLVEMLGDMLRQIEVPIIPSETRPAHERATVPRMSFLDTQALLEQGLAAINMRHPLTPRESAQAAVIAVALLIKECASVLDPDAGFHVAVVGFVEGAKTLPHKQPADATTVVTKPWYERWRSSTQTLQKVKP